MRKTVNFIDIEDYYGNSYGRIELSSPIEITSNNIDVPNFVLSDVNDDVMRVQFDGEEGGFYEFDDVDESSSELFEYIRELTEEDVDDEIHQEIREIITEIMRPDR